MYVTAIGLHGRIPWDMSQIRSESLLLPRFLYIVATRRAQGLQAPEAAEILKGGSFDFLRQLWIIGNIGTQHREQKVIREDN
jgi:hypothetical protein